MICGHTPKNPRDGNREEGEMVAGHSVINRILFATDFSTCARHAEEHVVFLSKAYGAAVQTSMCWSFIRECMLPSRIMGKLMKDWPMPFGDFSGQRPP